MNFAELMALLSFVELVPGLVQKSFAALQQNEELTPEQLQELKTRMNDAFKNDPNWQVID